VWLLAPLPDPESDAAVELGPELGVAAVPALELESTEELVLGVRAAGVVDSVGALCFSEWVDRELGPGAALVLAIERARG
jgi:hypothetical protein